MGPLRFAALPAGVVLAALAGGAIAIVVLHLVARRRRVVAVGFLALWERVLDERRSWRGLRRPRELLSLLVSLAVLSAIVLAAGDPRPVEGSEGRTLVIAVEAGGSMRALDETDARGRPIARADR